MSKKKYILLSLLLAAFNLLPIQADDFGVWTDAEMSQKLGNSGFSADFGLGFRANNNLKSVDRWSVGAGLNYDITRFLEAGIGYDFIYSYNHSFCQDKFDNTTGEWKGYNIENGYWRPKNRFHFDLKGSLTVGRFSFSLRERYQLTGYNSTTMREDKYRFNKQHNLDGSITYIPREPSSEIDYKDHKTKHYLRSRFQAEYNIPKCPVNPYAAFEISNNLSNGFSADKRRYSIGADWKIVKGQHLSFGYLYSDGNDDDELGNQHVIEVSYKIKGLFTKK